MAITAPKGMRDMLPDEALYWKRFQDMAADIFGRYGYVPIDTPLAEQTDLFVRGIGEATDVVSKEMFNVISGENLNTLLHGGRLKANQRLSLRPEGTAGVVRAIVQHDLVPQGATPAKLMYAGPMFRAERPQEGRYRQFHQIGIECLGADDPTIDAEGIVMCMRFFEAVGFDPSDIVLLVNSMGCDECRPRFREMVLEYARSHEDELCDDCRNRMDVNPLRMFDCKKDGCREAMEGAPVITDHLCDSCREHYGQVLGLVRGAGIAFTEDPSLVRGLDYYSRTVFEVQIASKDGAQNAIGGGGRYDKLADEVKGGGSKADLPGFGFALGYERCKEALVKKGLELPDAKKLDVYIACAGDEARSKCFALAQSLRDSGIVCDFDHQGKSLKSQFKAAGKQDAGYVVVLGEEELARNEATLRDMGAHAEERVPLSDLAARLELSIG